MVLASFDPTIYEMRLPDKQGAAGRALGAEGTAWQRHGGVRHFGITRAQAARREMKLEETPLLRSLLGSRNSSRSTLRHLLLSKAHCATEGA